MNRDQIILQGYAAYLTYEFAAQAVKRGDMQALESAMPRLLSSDRKIIERMIAASANRNEERT